MMDKFKSLETWCSTFATGMDKSEANYLLYNMKIQQEESRPKEPEKKKKKLLSVTFNNTIKYF